MEDDPDMCQLHQYAVEVAGGHSINLAAGFPTNSVYHALYDVVKEA